MGDSTIAKQLPKVRPPLPSRPTSNPSAGTRAVRPPRAMHMDRPTGSEFRMPRLASQPAPAFAPAPPPAGVPQPAVAPKPASLPWLQRFASIGRFLEYAGASLAVFSVAQDVFLAADEIDRQMAWMPGPIVDPAVWDDPHAAESEARRRFGAMPIGDLRRLQEVRERQDHYGAPPMVVMTSDGSEVRIPRPGYLNAYAQQLDRDTNGGGAMIVRAQDERVLIEIDLRRRQWEAVLHPNDNATQDTRLQDLELEILRLVMDGKLSEALLKRLELDDLKRLRDVASSGTSPVSHHLQIKASAAASNAGDAGRPKTSEERAREKAEVVVPASYQDFLDTINSNERVNWKYSYVRTADGKEQLRLVAGNRDNRFMNQLVLAGEQMIVTGDVFEVDQRTHRFAIGVFAWRLSKEEQQNNTTQREQENLMRNRVRRAIESLPGSPFKSSARAPSLARPAAPQTTPQPTPQAPRVEKVPVAAPAKFVPTFPDTAERNWWASQGITDVSVAASYAGILGAVRAFGETAFVLVERPGGQRRLRLMKIDDKNALLHRRAIHDTLVMKDEWVVDAGTISVGKEDTLNVKRDSTLYTVTDDRVIPNGRARHWAAAGAGKKHLVPFIGSLPVGHVDVPVSRTALQPAPISSSPASEEEKQVGQLVQILESDDARHYTTVYVAHGSAWFVFQPLYEKYQEGQVGYELSLFGLESMDDNGPPQWGIVETMLYSARDGWTEVGSRREPPEVLARALNEINANIAREFKVGRANEQARFAAAIAQAPAQPLPILSDAEIQINAKAMQTAIDARIRSGDGFFFRVAVDGTGRVGEANAGNGCFDVMLKRVGQTDQFVVRRISGTSGALRWEAHANRDVGGNVTEWKTESLEHPNWAAIHKLPPTVPIDAIDRTVSALNRLTAQK